jgi:hypothetical protein
MLDRFTPDMSIAPPAFRTRERYTIVPPEWWNTPAIAAAGIGVVVLFTEPGEDKYSMGVPDSGDSEVLAA